MSKWQHWGDTSDAIQCIEHMRRYANMRFCMLEGMMEGRMEGSAMDAREMEAQAMEAELYLTGKRAGSVAASAEWPRVERKRPAILSKALRATQELFGRDGVTRNAGYYVGWVDGYSLRCSDLLHRHA